MAKKPKAPILTTTQRRHLRGLGHHLTPKVMLGKDGLSDQFLKAAAEVINADELVKVRVLESCPHERKEAGELLATATATALVQVLGRTVLLYRPNPERQADKRIVLP